MANVYESVTELIGGTPLLKVKNYAEKMDGYRGPLSLYAIISGVIAANGRRGSFLFAAANKK